ncbi:transcriptional regulator, IclR family [Alteribacillus persepolensis]|uniref:Transcriptional regulator, IclR family n=1 Tax=Alteribacillus persepolensis TaxID=568899 RepID=A0A1G8GXL3_9BACI|nr:IclR family transcriptional regulator [Alteribacillus persepolensis]SDH99165.1 transcriptional regulator, IclR family [Alteribacillus persepolensis]
MLAATEEKKGIQSIELAYSVLKTISNADKPLTITEISKACGMSKSQLYRYLISLCKIGFLERKEDLTYSLGSELTLLGLRSIEKVDIREKAQPFIQELNDSLDETIALAIWGEIEGPIFISWEESKKPINLNVRVGSTMPLTQSATGKIFSAFYPREKTLPFIEKELEQNGKTLEEFETVMEGVKRDGYASINDYIPGITALSAPIFNQNKDLVAAMNVIGLSSVLNVSPESQAVQELLESCRILSRKLGYSI